MSCRTPIFASPSSTPLGPGEPGGTLPPGVVPNTFLQWNGVLWVPSSWTLPDAADVGDVGDVLTVTGANAADWAAPPVISGTRFHHYAFGANQINTGTGSLFPWFSTGSAALSAATATTAQFTGTIHALYVTHGTPTGADDIVYTVMVNDVATGLALILNSGSAGPATNLGSIVGVTVGDKITVRATGLSANRVVTSRLQFLLEEGATAPTTPLSIMGANTVAWWRSDLGVNPGTNGAGVNNWMDQGPGSFNLVQATAANQPTYNTTGGPNSTPSLLFDGVNDRLVNAAINRPAPATTRTVVWIVFRQVTWTNTDKLFGFGTTATHMGALQSGVTPQIGMQNLTTVNLNNALAVNTYGRGEFGFSGSTSDYIKLVATTVTGASAGNTDPLATFTLGASGPQTLFANIQVVEVAIFDAVPTAGQTTSLNSYLSSRYGL